MFKPTPPPNQITSHLIQMTFVPHLNDSTTESNHLDTHSDDLATHRNDLLPEWEEL
ncbi:MAG: hypothetical protein KME43_10545 [Myxacorys chilensis ATA2-1-KO14]|nr:hypothetical protein [Myxacorys chilensis ATA2-1-KO14]